MSILIPAHNAGRWIEETLVSALAQTWPRKEIIVVDDGSRDETLTIARKFASRQLLVLSQPNQGAAAARNKAFSLCQGDYIQWLDADDLLAPDKIAQQMEVVESSGGVSSLLSCPWGQFLYRPSRATFSPTPLWCDLGPVEWLIRKLDQNVYMHPACWLTSHELAIAAGPWDVRLCTDDDGEYFCRVILASEGTRFVPQAKVFYRKAGFQGVSYLGFSSKKLEAQVLSLKLHFDYLRRVEDSPRVRAACLAAIQRWMICFYPEKVDLLNELEQLASELGGRLGTPQMPWKYLWIQKLFGWTMAKRAQLTGKQCRAFARRNWDLCFGYFEERWNTQVSDAKAPFGDTR